MFKFNLKINRKMTTDVWPISRYVLKWQNTIGRKASAGIENIAHPNLNIMFESGLLIDNGITQLKD